MPVPRKDKSLTSDQIPMPGNWAVLANGRCQKASSHRLFLRHPAHGGQGLSSGALFFSYSSFISRASSRAFLAANSANRLSISARVTN